MADSAHSSAVVSNLPPPMDGRKEFIGRTASPDTVEWFPGLRGHLFAGASRGAKKLTTFVGSLETRAQTQFHRHPCSEVVTPLDGDIVALVDRRRYDLRHLKSIHFPVDVWKQAGGGLRAYVENVPVTITPGELEIAFVTQSENPSISALEIIPAP